jgi:hypothetical protein
LGSDTPHPHITLTKTAALPAVAVGTIRSG